MINSTMRSATATTLTRVSMARVDRSQFREMIARDTDFALHIMSVLANRLRVLNEFVTSQIGN